MTILTIKAGSKASYKASENTGAIVDRPALNLLKHDVQQIARAEAAMLPSGKIAGGLPKTKAALKALNEYTAAPLTVKGAQRLQKAFRRVADDPEESSIGVKLLDQLDDFFTSLPPKAFSQGNGAEAIRHWTAAKVQWARFKRTESLETALYKARFAKGGLAAGLRQQLKTIITTPKKSRGFTNTEIEAMERFVEGGSVQEFLEFMTKGGTLPAAVTGHVLGGPVVGAAAAIAKPIAGLLARGKVNGDARRAVDLIRANVATPGGLPPMPQRLPNVPTINGIARRIGVGGINPMMDDPRNRMALALSHGRGRR